MNEEAANALLKTLEEPPPRSLVILISHAPGRLLPTMRSRVQRLVLKPLSEDLLRQLLERLAPDANAESRAVLARVADGSPGVALRLADEDGADLAKQAESLVLAREPPDWLATLKLAERIGRRGGDLPLFGAFLHRAVLRRLTALARNSAANDRSVELAEHLNALFTRAVAVNLEPRQTVLTAANLIAAAKRRGAL